MTAHWRPWLRGGYLYASGDGDPSDDKHGTFSEMLPTVRRYAQRALYSQMNNTDLFAQLLARPRPRINVRLDLHRVRLASVRDACYFGSGATQQHRSIFGFATRPWFGATHLAMIRRVGRLRDWAALVGLRISRGWTRGAAWSRGHLPDTRSRSRTSRTSCSFD